MKFFNLLFVFGFFFSLLSFTGCKKSNDRVLDEFLGTYEGEFILVDSSTGLEYDEPGTVNVSKAGKKTYEFNSSTHPQFVSQLTMDVLPHSGIPNSQGGVGHTGYANENPDIAFSLVKLTAASDTTGLNISNYANPNSQIPFKVFVGIKIE